MVQKKMLVEEFQGGLFSAWSSLMCECGYFSYSESPFCRKPNHKVSDQADIWFGKRCRLKNSKMAV